MNELVSSVLAQSALFPRDAWAHVRRMLTPHLGRVRAWTRASLRADVIAGLTVATIVIPNAMGYAMLAGLPAQAGLYATFAGTIFGVLWGSSAFVITGSVGIVSLLILTTLLPFATPGSPEFATLAIMMALLVGFIQLIAGLLRLGFLARLIPNAVLVGFSSAAALIIAMTQVPTLLGFSITQKAHVIATFVELLRHLNEIQLLSAGLGILTIVFLTVARRVAPGFPAALAALGGGMALSYVFSFDRFGIATIGAIPSHLPTLVFPVVSIAGFAQIFGSALIIAVIGFMSTYAIGKAIAQKSRERISADQELVGQGGANIMSGLFGGLPVSGSLSASAVNVDSGARTGLSSIVAAGAILIALLFFTPVLQFLPRTVLSAIIIAAVLHLVDIKKMAESFVVSKTDGTIAFITFSAAFIFKLDDAVVIGILLSLLFLMSRIMFADVSVVGFDRARGDILRRVGAAATVETEPGLLIVRANRSILYANSEHIIIEIRALIDRYRASGDAPRLLVLNFASVNEIDMTALEDLELFFAELHDEGLAVGIIYAKDRERARLVRSHGSRAPIAFFHNISEMRAYYVSAAHGQATLHLTPIAKRHPSDSQAS